MNPDLASCKATTIPAQPSEMQETIDITWTEMTGGFSGQQGARGNNRTIQRYPSWSMDPGEAIRQSKLRILGARVWS